MSQTETTSEVLAFTSPSKQLGALDLGSNSFHLLIAQESHGRMQVLDKHKEMVRLAEGLQEDDTLSPEVMERALACLERFAQRLRPLDPDNVRIVGTNTLRKAHESDFIDRAEQVLGHKIEIISGREEARLIYMGVCHDLGVDNKHRLVVDIGGGSTELILGRKTTPEQLESLYMGCVSMSQRHFGKGKVTKSNMQAAIKHALLELEPVAHEFTAAGWESCVGASGTINAVRDVITAATGADQITAADLADIRNRLISHGEISTLQLSGLAEERKTVFPGGVAVLSAVFEALKIDAMNVSQGALREGLIYDLLGRRHEDDTREHTVRKLMQHYRIDATHARQVRETAISLLSQVAVAWQLTESWHKLCLSWAASLHELGMDISHSGYHKHGAYLLENMDMPGFSRLEQQQLSTLVRTHRRKLSADMFGEDNVDLMRLGVLLRLAVVLHRSRSHETLPHIGARADGQLLTVSAPKAWLKQHPLTTEDLRNEAAFIAALSITLKVEQGNL